MRLNEVYKFETITENKLGYTVLDASIGTDKREVHIDNKYFSKVEKFKYFKIERGMQGNWKYLTRVTKEEADQYEKEAKEIEEKKKIKKEKIKVEKEIKKESKEFDDLLSSI